ncbi:MAG: exosortase E/protease, VPEID-CTERM system [Planctomycetota bacterium]
MSPYVAKPTATASARRSAADPSAPPPLLLRPTVRAALVAGVLLLEYGLISASFDAQQALDGGAWGLARHLGTLAPLAVAAATAALLLEGRALRERLQELGGELSGHSTLVPGLLHLFACFGLFVATWRCFSPDLPAPGPVWLVMWLCVGLATVGTAVSAAFPPRAALRFVRESGRPLLVGAGVGLLGWGAALGSEGLWAPLREPTLAAVERLLALVPGEVLRRPGQPVIGLDDFHVSVAPVCSGYQGMGLMAVFVSTFLYWRRAAMRFPAALLLLPLALAASWLANVLRITALIVVGARLSPELALGGFHAKAGWVLFCALALGVVTVARRSSALSVLPEPEVETWNPTAAYLSPLMALIAVALCTGLFVGEGVDPLYALRLVAAAAALWVFRAPILGTLGDLRPLWSWEACGVGALVFAVWMAPELLHPLGPRDVYPQGLSSLSAGGEVGWLLLRALGLVVVVPVVEELAFRGFLLRWLSDREDFTRVPFGAFSWPALLLSSLAFGALHEKWVAGILAGLAYGLVLRRRGRLGDAVLAHAVTNALLGLTVLWTCRWSLL